MRLSYSELSTYRRCPRQYRYRAVDRIQRKKKSVNLFLGSAVHRLLLAYYTGHVTIDEEAATMRDEAEAKKTLFDDELAAEEELIRQAYNIVQRYISYWTDEGLTPLHVEEEFTLYIPGLEVTFTPDLVVEAAYGENSTILVFDHKTCARLPEEHKLWTMQSLLYSAGVKQMHPRLSGFIFNYIRKKAPVMPRLTKDGRIADIGRVDTDYETLSEFIRETDPNLFNDKLVATRLAWLQPVNNFYRRDFIPYREDASEKVLDEVQFTAEQIKADSTYPRTYLESGYMDCAHCEFSSICNAELLHYDVHTVLKEEYEPREAKNPYESEGEE